jgi:hypothetical protein
MKPETKSLNMPGRFAGGVIAFVLLERLFSGSFAMPPAAVVLADLLAGALLTYAAWVIPACGWRLAGAVFLLYFGVNRFNTMDETLIFRLGLSTKLIATIILTGLVVAALYAPLVVWILGRTKGESPRVEFLARTKAGWVWRIAVGDLAYVLVYFVAGMLVFPYIRSFYTPDRLPPVQTVILMQVFRGLVYVLIALVISRMLAGRSHHAAFLVGAAFSVFGGVAPLMVPNPILPDAVRHAHLVEVGVSNFVYGAFLGYLLTPRARGTVRLAAGDPAPAPAKQP